MVEVAIAPEVVDEEFMRRHEGDIVRLAMDSVQRGTGFSKEFINRNREEFLQDVRIKVWRFYDPARGLLSSYVYRVAPQVMVELFRRMRSGAFKEAGHAVLDERVEGFASAPAVDDFETLTERVWLSSLAQTVLTDRERQVFDFMSEGFRLHEAAERMGITRSRVTQLRAAIAAKFRASLDAIGSV